MNCRQALSHIYNSRIDNAIAKERQRENVSRFNEIDRKGLKYDELERSILLYETKYNEKIYIQLPGKESKSNSDASKVRPYDFRPKLQFNNGWLKDLSFKDVWDDISNIHKASNEALSVFAAVLVKMAFMCDYKLVKQSCPFGDIDLRTKKIVNSGNIELQWYQPNFNQDIYDYLQEMLGNIRGISIQAYLLYNDLLVQNEDCKYCYRDEIINKKEWNYSTGRRNTIRTHLSVIEFVKGLIPFSEIMDRFTRGKGIAAMPIRDIPIVTDNIITKA